MFRDFFEHCSAKSNEVIEGLLEEDKDVKKRRERARLQASLLSRLTGQLSVHEARAGWAATGGGK